MEDYRVRNIDMVRGENGKYYDKAIFIAGKRTPLAYISSVGSKFHVYTANDNQFIGTGNYSKGALAIFRLFGGHN